MLKALILCQTMVQINVCRNAAKTWMVVMKPPSGFGNFVVFHDGQSSNNYTGVFSSGASTNFYAECTLRTQEPTLNNRVNGTDVANNRGTAYSALTLGSWNSITHHRRTKFWIKYL